MNIRIDSNFQFSVVSIQYTATGELSISLTSDGISTNTCYQYTANLGSVQAEERPTISLLQYAKTFAMSANINSKTKDSSVVADVRYRDDGLTLGMFCIVPLGWICNQAQQNNRICNPQ